MHIDGLRSPYETIHGIPAVGRTLDKIRLHHRGDLPDAYHRFLGSAIPLTMDAAVCRFFQADYEALKKRTLDGGSDEEIVAWIFTTFRRPSDHEIQIFHDAMGKRGWRDETSAMLRERVAQHGFSPDAILTWPDLLDADEGRPPRYPADPPPVPGPFKASALIPGLRSPYETLGGIVHLPRLIDKIRLSANDALPPAWSEHRGAPTGFDGEACGLLGIDYAAAEGRIREGVTDDAFLDWALATGRCPDPFEIALWNAYLSKRCWRDRFLPRLEKRLGEAHLPSGAVLTMFDFIDLDEGRPPRFPR